jgi:hypothetical protein
MYNNVLPETIFTQQIYEEYLKLIGKYQNLSRPSIFCRYLNINVNESSYNIKTDSTFDHYNSGIRYDVYDYTPLFYTSQIVNDSIDQPELMGQMFHATSNVVVYTIKDVRIEDLVLFSYSPQTEGEIFRVTNSRIALNAKTAVIPTNWYELTLEYAPVIDYKKLNLLNFYTYTLTLEKYLLSTDFKRMVRETDKMAGLFKELEETFDPTTELYYLNTQDGQKIAPLQHNKIIYDFLANLNSYEGYFTRISRPFGIKEYGDTKFLNITTGQIMDTFDPVLLMIDIEHFEFDIQHEDFVFVNEDDVIESILSYNGKINLFDMTQLIDLWIWYKDRNIDEYPEPILSRDKFQTVFDEDLDKLVIFDHTKFDIHKNMRRKVEQPYRLEPGS